jgi:hypothetical protein
MMKEKIRALDLRLTDLSEYLKISRPSLYKYLELYEKGQKKHIPENVLKMFLYIDKTKNINKDTVITYIATNLFTDTSTSKNVIRKYVSNVSETDPKLNFVYELLKTKEADPLIPYLTECLAILQKEEISDTEMRQISLFISFREKVSINSLPSDDDIDLTKRFIRGR